MAWSHFKRSGFSSEDSDQHTTKMVVIQILFSFIRNDPDKSEFTKMVVVFGTKSAAKHKIFFCPVTL